MLSLTRTAILLGGGLALAAAFGLAPALDGAWPLALALTLAPGARPDPPAERRNDVPAEERQQGNWHVYPLEGSLDLAYCDVAGNASIRRLWARELKVGPGKVLLGGIDAADDGYRGFRADRIELLVDAETGQTVRHNIVDWLLKRAEQQARERRKAARAS